MNAEVGRDKTYKEKGGLAVEGARNMHDG